MHYCSELNGVQIVVFLLWTNKKNICFTLRKEIRRPKYEKTLTPDCFGLVI